LKDDTQANPLDLLSRYRTLCEATGAARATHTSLPRNIQEQLARVETELQTRLWLASAENTTPGYKGTKSARQEASPSKEDHHFPGVGEDILKSDTSASATVYSDGACLGNPGPGGYCAIVRVPGNPEKMVSGGKARTTNNEMEMTAAIEGLKVAIAQGAREITVVSDSEYLVKGMTGWVRGWLRNGWKTSRGEPVKNRPLWEELHRLSQGRSVTWSWIRGHAGHPENERCDAVAVAAAHEASKRR
jgi:ribonuclease HI